MEFNDERILMTIASKLIFANRKPTNTSLSFLAGPREFSKILAATAIKILERELEMTAAEPVTPRRTQRSLLRINYGSPRGR